MFDEMWRAVSTHANDAGIGVLGGLVAALRSRWRGWIAFVTFMVIGGICAPFAGSWLRARGADPGTVEAAMFVSGYLANPILDKLEEIFNAWANKLKRAKLGK